VKLEDCRYVVIEGPIGAGKTSLARRMAVHLGGEALLEKPEENPFWIDFTETCRATRCRHSYFSCFSALTSFKA
jgi:deoxyadenosine/deoxycytidine kinase